MLVTSKYVLHVSSNIQSMCRPFIKKYSSKSDKIKRLMKEYKLIFGPLVETKSQKKRRLKLEKKGEIPHEKTNMIHTEFLWVMENARDKLKKITKPQNEQSNDTDQSSIKKFSEMEFDGSTDQHTKNLLHSESSQTAQEIDLRSNSTSNLSAKNSNNEVASSNSNVSDNENTVTKCVSSNFERFPDIIIKNLPTFPIMGSKQELPTQSTEILSISVRDDLETIRFPSVTKILTQTMSPESKLALEAWKERMIKKLGQEGFEMHQKALLEDGSSLHSCIAQDLLGKEYEVPSKIEPVFKSVQGVLKDVHHVRAIETHVAHPKLRYKGVVDCIASYRGENYVIDWKKSDRKKLDLKGTYDAPVQLAAYIGAINVSNLYPFVIKRGLLVIAYTCGAPATVYEVSDNTLQQYWTAWLHRLQKYYVETTSSDGNENIYTPIKR
ncbi:mitochondrial genome maintenance exonuclease 1 [Temnothorax longispinosus]|uniref:Mitochondrial genome maintenance exonuclease 1 n=1 Tax=Temnothorax longispinosus TaxID=300112 RepID=A0A4S2KBQ9_9HYME|nr:Mitochondrial genome maintenance exonuclease 1 [Temnothorax longispinosus]